MFKTLRYRGKHCKTEPLPIIRYMFYLLFVTFAIVGTSLSRYVSTSSVDGLARVAKYNVSSAITTSIKMTNGVYDDISAHELNGEKNYTFIVTNNSEVSIRARLVIDSSENTATVSGSSATMSSWYDLAPGEEQYIAITVIGSLDGNNVKLHVESEQLD